MLNRAAHVYFSKKLTPLGLGPGQQAYLLVVLPGEKVSQDEIARRLVMDKANVARALASLERLGYVHRRPAQADRRVRLVTLTEEGAAARETVEGHMRAWVGELRKAVAPGQWEQLVSTIEAVARRAMEHAMDS